MDGSDGGITPWMYFMPQNIHLKMVKMVNFMLCLFYYKSSFSYFPGFCWLLPLSQKLGVLIALMVAPWFAYWPQLGSQLEEVLTILPPALYLWSILPGSLLSFSGEKAPNSAIRPHRSPGIICSIYSVLSLGIYPSVLSCKVTSPLVTLTNPPPILLKTTSLLLGHLTHSPHVRTRQDLYAVLTQ